MAFNRASFNRTPFNRAGDSVLYGSGAGFETVSASIGSGLDFYGIAQGFERVNVNLNGDPAWLTSVIGTETIAEQVLTGQIVVYAVASARETINAQTSIAADLMPEVSGLEEVISAIVLNVKVLIELAGLETVDADTALGATIYPGVTAGYELVTESASLENIEERTCVLTVTLHPGQVLIVDANNYNVLLDSENAIDVQSGAWIDELNRNTTDIRIEAASGSANLSATILYTERYL